MIVPLYLISFSMSIAKAQDQNQALKEPENVNVTSSDTGVYERINVTADNQTQQQNLLPLMQPSQQTVPPMILHLPLHDIKFRIMQNLTISL